MRGDKFTLSIIKIQIKLKIKQILNMKRVNLIIK